MSRIGSSLKVIDMKALLLEARALKALEVYLQKDHDSHHLAYLRVWVDLNDFKSDYESNAKANKRAKKIWENVNSRADNKKGSKGEYTINLPSHLRAVTNDAVLGKGAKDNSGNSKTVSKTAFDDLQNFLSDTLQQGCQRGFLISQEYLDFLGNASDEYRLDSVVMTLFDFKEDRQLQETKMCYLGDLKAALQLENVLEDPLLAGYFRRFLRLRFQEENFLFFHEVQDLKVQCLGGQGKAADRKLTSFGAPTISRKNIGESFDQTLRAMHNVSIQILSVQYKAHSLRKLVAVSSVCTINFPPLSDLPLSLSPPLTLLYQHFHPQAMAINIYNKFIKEDAIFQVNVSASALLPVKAAIKEILLVSDSSCEEEKKEMVEHIDKIDGDVQEILTKMDLNTHEVVLLEEIEEEAKNLVERDPSNIFDDAQREIFLQMRSGGFSDFKKHDLFEQFKKVHKRKFAQKNFVVGENGLSNVAVSPRTKTKTGLISVNSNVLRVGDFDLVKKEDKEFTFEKNSVAKAAKEERRRKRMFQLGIDEGDSYALSDSTSAAASLRDDDSGDDLDFMTRQNIADFDVDMDDLPSPGSSAKGGVDDVACFEGEESDELKSS